MRRTDRLLPHPAMAWRFLAGLLVWLVAVIALGSLSGAERAGTLELMRSVLAPSTMQAAAVTAVLWLGGLLLGSVVALALALLSSRRFCWPLVLPSLALEYAALLPVWILPWWIARESLERRLPLPGLWRSWGLTQEEIGHAHFDPVPWMMMLLVALVVAGVTVGRMRHALLRARRRLIRTPPLRARGLRAGALEYRHRLGGAAPAILHAMRDALPWSLMMLVFSGVILQGPGLARWMGVGGSPGLPADSTSIAAWLWLGWCWCLLTAVGAWAERLSGGVPMVLASLQRPHGTLLGIESGRWTWLAWAVPPTLFIGACLWMVSMGQAARPIWFGLVLAVLVWMVSVYQVSGRSTTTGLWLAYLARGGGHWPWWAAALWWTWGLDMPWWQGLLLPVAGLVLEGTSRARQLASFWIRAGGVREAAEVTGLPLNHFRWRSLLPALGLAMLPWMLARAALLLFGAFILQAAVWLPDVLLIHGSRLDGREPLFPEGLETAWQLAWPLALVVLVLRLIARLWERLRWLLADRRAVGPDSVVMREH